MSVDATPTPRDSAGSDRRLAIDLIPAAWYRPRRAVYWTDFLLSASIGWASLLALLRVTPGWRVLFFLTASFALYRAALFIHELTHVSARALPHFELAWNVFIGVPFLIPSFLYQVVHLDHHRKSTYGTADDPEYLPFAHKRPGAIGLYLVGALLFPAAAVVRFAFLGPASWANRRIRRLTLEHFSALAINAAYTRRGIPEGRWRMQEFGCAAVCWVAFCAWFAGWMSGRVLLVWAAAGTTISLLNAIRALAAHRYENDGRELTMSEQLMDSCTLSARSRSIVRQVWSAPQAVLAPVGLRYHALHHWIPTLPYHNLGRAHRLLLLHLEKFPDYGATQSHNMSSTLATVIRRSIRQRA